MPEPPYSNPKQIRAIRILKPVPWLLLSLFALSFAWDFDGRTFTLFAAEYTFDGILRIISVSGLIGFLTNWAAITMLFRPISRRPLLGQGLIPSHKDRIARRLAQTVSDDLVNPELIRQKIESAGLIKKIRESSKESVTGLSNDPEFRLKVKNWLIQYTQEFFSDPDNRNHIAAKLSSELDKRLENRILEKAAVKLYSIVKKRELEELIDDVLLEIPESVKTGIDEMDPVFEKLPQLIDNNSDQADLLLNQLLNTLIDRLDIYALVEENLNSYDEQKLETMIRGATNEQLKTIQYLGAVLGTIGGFVIWEPVLSLVVIGFLAGLIYAADYGLGSVSG